MLFIRTSVPHPARFTSVRPGGYRWGLLVGCLALLAVLTGCSPLDGEDEATIADSMLPSLVLQPEDLPNVFTRFDEGPQAIADAPFGDRADPERFGRNGGWKSRFRRPGSAATRGPLVVESRAELFGGSSGAGRELDAHKDELGLQAHAPSDAELVEVDQLGDEAVALTQGSGAAPGSVVFHTLVWRYGNVTASIAANGFAGKLLLADVLELARAQQRRIVAAASSGT